MNNSRRRGRLPLRLGLLRYRATRFWWYVFYYGFARHLPVSHHYPPVGKIAKYLRGVACSHLFQRAGKNINIEHGAHFESGWCVEIGDHSSIGVNARVPGDVRIGRDVMMAPDVIILGPDHKFDDLSVPMRLQGYAEPQPVTIEDDVWIGTRVIILPGLVIGQGAIIGAGAVVTKDVPRYAICVGNPARVVRFRDQAQMPAVKRE